MSQLDKRMCVAPRASDGSAKHSMKMLWLDAAQWSELYRDVGVRQPPHSLPASPKYLRRYLRKIGLTVSQFLESTGTRTLAEFQEMNPRVPLFAAIGMTLECKSSGDFKDRKI